MLAGEDIVKDMARGPEAYLQMWERAYGIAPNACSNPSSLLSPATFASRVRPGMTDWATPNAVGQPDRRLGNSSATARRGRGDRAVQQRGQGDPVVRS